MSNTLLVVVTTLVGAALGWSTHVAWLRSRVTIHPVRRGGDGPIVEWLVNIGRPIVGRYRTKMEAQRARRRLLNAIEGRVDSPKGSSDV